MGMPWLSGQLIDEHRIRRKTEVAEAPPKLFEIFLEVFIGPRYTYDSC